MSYEKVIRCDAPGCTQVRGEGNKWFSIEWSCNTTDYAPIILPFSDEESVLRGHLCSEECAHKVLDAWLQKIRKMESEEALQ